MKIKRFVYYLLLIKIFTAHNLAYAYIDPGTGGIIIQSILAALAAAGSFCIAYYEKLKSFLSNLFDKNNKTENTNKINNTSDKIKASSLIDKDTKEK